MGVRLARRLRRPAAVRHSQRGRAQGAQRVGHDDSPHQGTSPDQTSQPSTTLATTPALLILFKTHLLANSTLSQQTQHTLPLSAPQPFSSQLTKMSESKTGAIPSVAAGGQHQLSEDTLIVVLGASGDLAKKKVS